MCFLFISLSSNLKVTFVTKIFLFFSTPSFLLTDVCPEIKQTEQDERKGRLAPTLSFLCLLSCFPVHTRISEEKTQRKWISLFLVDIWSSSYCKTTTHDLCSANLHGNLHTRSVWCLVTLIIRTTRWSLCCIFEKRVTKSIFYLRDCHTHWKSIKDTFYFAFCKFLVYHVPK